MEKAKGNGMSGKEQVGPLGTPRVSLRRNFSWTFVGNLVYAGSQWLMLALIAKLGTPAMVGAFAVAQAVTAPIIVFTNLQLREIQATDARGQYQFGEYFSTRILTSLLALVIIGCTATWSQGSQGDYFLLVMAMGLARVVESWADILYGYMQQREALKMVSISLILKGLGSILGMITGMALTGSVLWGTLGMTLAWICVVVLFDFPQARKARSHLSDASLSPRWNLVRMKNLVLMACPLGMATALCSLTANYPRYIIEGELGTAALGIFAAMAALNIAGKRITDALDQAAIPRLALYCVEGNRRALVALIWKLLGIGAFLGAGSTVVCWIWGKPIMSHLFTPEYATRLQVLVLLAIGGGIGFMVNFLMTAMSAMRQFRRQFLIHLVNFLFIISFAPRFIRHGNLEGAAWLNIVGGIFQLAVTGLVLVRSLKRMAFSESAGKGAWIPPAVGGER